MPPVKCSSCPAMVDFAVTETGKLMPVDHDSAGDSDGNLEVWRDELGHLRCRVLIMDEALAPGRQRGVVHWSTCTDPGAYRRRRS